MTTSEPRFYVRESKAGYAIGNPLRGRAGNETPQRSVTIYDRAYNHRAFAAITVTDRRNVHGARLMAQAVADAMNAREREEELWPDPPPDNAEERQRADDNQRALDENDEQRDYAEERYNAMLLEEE